MTPVDAGAAAAARRRSAGSGRLPVPVLAHLTLVVAAGLSSCGERTGDSPPPATPTDVAAAPEGREPDATVGPYVGVSACRECHADRVAEYEQTAHFATLRRATAAVLGARFAGRDPVFRTRNPSLHFEVEREGDEFFQTAVVASDQGETRTRKRIDLVVGSGRIFEGYLTFEGEHLRQLPIGYMAASDHWANCPGYVDGEADFDRPIEPRCLDCHGTWLEHRPGTKNQYDPATIVPGIACERCHGSAREHVTWHRAHPDAPESRHIIAPLSLTRDRRLDQCAQCHADPGELLAPAFSYRPGEPLSDYVRQDPAHASEAFIHTANQVQHLRASPCFIASPALECISCHDPHIDERARIGGVARQRCAGCHEDEACGARPELPSALRDACVDCHMPKRSAILTTFSTTDDDYVDAVRLTEHRIAVHRLDADELTVAWLGGRDDAAERERGRVLGEDLAARFQGAAREHAERRDLVASLAMWRRAVRLTPDDGAARAGLENARAACRRADEARAILLQGLAALRAGDQVAAETRFREAVRRDEGLAEAHYNLAVQLAARGEVEGALTGYRRAVALDAGHADSWNNLGSLLGARGEDAEARACFERAAELAPRHPEAHRNLATNLVAARRLGEAIPCFERHLALVPNDVEARTDLGRALAALGRLEEAEHHLRAALRLDETRIETLYTLGGVLAERRAPEEAVAMLDRVLALDPEHAPTLVARGDLETLVGGSDQALGFYLRSLLGADDPETHLKIARLSAEAGRLEEAIDHGERAAAGFDRVNLGMAAALRRQIALWKRQLGR